MANLDTDGSTISELARRTGITRQAASQQIAELEKEHYVTRRPDPRDSRAVMVQRTAHGQELLMAALDIVAELETGYEAHLGAEDAQRLRELLLRLLEFSDPSGGLAGQVE